MYQPGNNKYSWTNIKTIQNTKNPIQNKTELSEKKKMKKCSNLKSNKI